MYESKETSIRGIVVTILLIILVICILIWIFPTKKDIKGISGANNEPLLSEIFGRNLRVLQNAGRAYYYSARLPKNVGDSTTATLGELIEDKMLLELKDKDGKVCDNNASYVQLTKTVDGDYELKSYLSCGSEADYILERLSCDRFKNGCKDITKKDEPKKEEPKESEKESEKEKSTIVSYYRYLYECPNKTSNYSDWSDWSTTYISSTSKREVETRVEYDRKYVKVGTKEEPRTTYETVESYDTVYEEKTYVNTIPSGATNCVTVPRSNYTLYKCQVATQKKTTTQEPKTTYVTVDVYDWQYTPVTYYRYRTLVSSTNYSTTWSTKSNNTSLINRGCTIIKSEKVTK